MKRVEVFEGLKVMRWVKRRKVKGKEGNIVMVNSDGDRTIMVIMMMLLFNRE